jgi:hypothetical protein
MIMLKDESLINELNFCFIKVEEATEIEAAVVAEVEVEIATEEIIGQ